jgi:hypothetical protein
MNNQTIKELLNEMLEKEMHQEYLDCLGIYLALGGRID